MEVTAFRTGDLVISKNYISRHRDPHARLCIVKSVKYELLNNWQGKIELIMDRYESKDRFIILLRSRRQTAKHKMKTPSSTLTVFSAGLRTRCAGSYTATLPSTVLPTGP
jgi:hypothetical protein